MATAIAVALRPNNEATRPPRSQRGKRVTTNVISSGNCDDNAKLLRIQRLNLLGIIGQRAQLLADLAWGSANV